MQFYRVHEAELDPPGEYQWYETRAEAHVAAKQGVQPQFRTNMRVELVDAPTDKASIAAVLNGAEPKVLTLKTWNLTARGALNEL